MTPFRQTQWALRGVHILESQRGTTEPILSVSFGRCSSNRALTAEEKAMRFTI